MVFPSTLCLTLAVNTISKDMAERLSLPVVLRKEDLSVLGSAGAGGSFQAGDIVMLGDCQLSGMPEEQENVTFMTNLTAAALELGSASSVGGGLLGTSFFGRFPAGVEFDWYGTDGDPPTIIFYFGKFLPDHAKKNAFCVPLEEESFFTVPEITVNFNGVDLRAIIDTGSPITIVSPDAAEEIGIGIGFREKNGPSLKIRGIDNGTVCLAPTLSKVSISIGKFSLGDVETIFVGDLPGISLASGYASSLRPQALVGLDILRLTYRMILRLAEKEVWFERLPE